MTRDGSLRDRRYLRFPPGSGFLLLPAGPRRATLAGLALYDTVAPRQRVMLRGGAVSTRLHLHRLLPTNTREDVDWGWWESLTEGVVAPLVGPVGHLALRVPPRPFSPCALLLDGSGRPLAFAKAQAAPPEGDEATIIERLAAARPDAFRTPSMLAAGHHGSVPYRVLEPLPEGPHHDPPFDPPRLWRIIDEYRDLLADLPRPAGAEPSHVPCHGDLHVRNLRRGSDGQLWLFDWERFRWAPRLADELRYWSSHFGGRVRGRADSHGRTVLELLRERGDDEEIRAALRWPDYQPKRDVQRAIYGAVERALAADPRPSGRGGGAGTLRGR